MTQVEVLKRKTKNAEDDAESFRRLAKSQEALKDTAHTCVGLLFIFLIATNSGWLFAFLWFGGSHGN